MNRRSFLKTSMIGGGTVLAFPAILSIEGCPSSTLKSYLNVVLESAQKILALSHSTDAWYADLSNAITAFENTESSWNGSTAVSTVISALDTIEGVLAVIPVTSAYSGLIALLVSAIEEILTLFVSTNSSSAANLKSLRSANPYRGRIALRKPHRFQSDVGAYKSQWDELAQASGLTSAKL